MAAWLMRTFSERVVRVRARQGTLCCVLGQDTLLSRCLSPHRSINGYRRIVGKPNKSRGVTCDELASRPGGVEYS